MENSFKNFFTKRSVLTWSAVIALIGYAANAVIKLIIGDAGSTTSAIGIILLIVCLLILVVSFYKHDKNVTKCMLGAVLLWFIKDDITYLGTVILPSASNGGEYSSLAGLAYIILEFITIALYLSLFLSHIIIISDHKSNTELVTLNLIIVVLASVVSLIKMFITLSVVNYETKASIEIISWEIAFIAFLFIIVCIQAEVDTFKIIRENKLEQANQQ